MIQCYLMTERYLNDSLLSDNKMMFDYKMIYNDKLKSDDRMIFNDIMSDYG